MPIIDAQLARIGFGRSEGAGGLCWQVARLDRGARFSAKPISPEPANSSALLCWRDRLAGDRDASPYRISRIDDRR